jgi:hypothetical protein
MAAGMVWPAQPELGLDGGMRLQGTVAHCPVSGIDNNNKATVNGARVCDAPVVEDRQYAFFFYCTSAVPHLYFHELVACTSHLSKTKYQ